MLANHRACPKCPTKVPLPMGIRALMVSWAHPVVTLLSKRWWIPAGARPEGPKLETEGPRAEMRFPTADHVVFEHSRHSVWLLWHVSSVWCLDSTKQSGGSQQKGVGSQLWGTGSVIRSSWSQIRGAGHKWVHIPNGISISSAVFAGPTNVSSRQITGHHGTSVTIDRIL